MDPQDIIHQIAQQVQHANFMLALDCIQDAIRDGVPYTIAGSTIMFYQRPLTDAD